MWESQVREDSVRPSLYDGEEYEAAGEDAAVDAHDDGSAEMIEGRAEQPHFARALRGYDRDQVDTYVAEYARWGSEALARIAELETKVSELEEIAETSRRYREEADELTRRAETVRVEAEERAQALVDAAEAKVDEFSRQSDRDREEAAELRQQAGD